VSEEAEKERKKDNATHDANLRWRVFRFFALRKPYQDGIVEIGAMTKTQKIALVEIGGSHDECLLTQMIALKMQGCEVLLICNPELLERNPHFANWIVAHLPVDMRGSKGEQRREVSRIWRWMQAQQIQKAVLNTAQGGMIRALCWKALFSKIEFIGILHTTRKLEGSFTQKLIHWKIKKYLFLSGFLLSKVKAPRGIALDYFYPIDFPVYHDVKAHEGIRIAIIGGVERRRKDLDGFCSMLEAVGENVHFTFLGYSNPQHEDVIWLKAELQRVGKADQVTIFEHFVDHEKFAEELAQSDWILPLVHPDTPSADQYFKNQISGAMTVAFGCQIPLLIHEAYAHIQEMRAGSAYYHPAHFAATLKEADPKAIRQEMMNLPQCATDLQQKRFADFVLKH
jgi:hypothetical protein